ncbi:alpha-amylase family protein [Aliidongia dinghuensis]|nr:alpha-amylase family protein [Aliidongia dinghuensis]
MSRRLSEIRASLAIASLAALLAGLAVPSAARADGPAWPDYQVIMWQNQTPARLDGLARLGVTAGTIHGRHGPIAPDEIARETAPFRALGLGWYVENIATDFYSAYHRWHPDRPVTWLFDEAKRLHRQDPADLTPFIRTPSLSDPAWLARIATRLKQHVAAFGQPRPLFFNLADEAGTGDLAAAWDFDFAPASLDGMRAWLQQQYGSLTALNREWDSRFTSWSAVVPMTTNEALRRPDENFAAWADFKEWMDEAFARAVRIGTNAVHAADPAALAALEGAQIPGWGGYDYSRLAGAVDVMEMYDFGNNVEIARALNPQLVVLHTSTLADASQIRAIWHALLLGGRGLILWDENGAFVDQNGAPTPRGRTLEVLTTELRSGLAAQLIASRPARDPVAILYSPESLRLQWLLDRKADGKPWAERQAETEYDEDNPVRAATRRAAGLLSHLGVSPQWLTPDRIETGALEADRIRVLVLPHTIALSPAEAQRIRKFLARGGTLLTDTMPGAFDRHGRRVERPPLADLAGRGRFLLLPDLMQDRAPGDPLPLVRLRRILATAGAPPPFTLSAADGSTAADIDARVFRDGDAVIVGLQRDGDGSAEQPQAITLELAAPAYVYDLRRPGLPQRTTRLTLAPEATSAAILALLPAPPPPLSIEGPDRLAPGGSADFTISEKSSAWRGGRIVHIEPIAPDGTALRQGTANLALDGKRTVWRLALPADATPGAWTIRLRDMFGGAELMHGIDVSKVADKPSDD